MFDTKHGIRRNINLFTCDLNAIRFPLLQAISKPSEFCHRLLVMATEN
jgi:hypothetical protein